ncbi:FAD:protein FMN transferase [Roseicella frigidaeris]|uniref:FAD:protein FMN transferase n=1 Tax=Roseicella frigidaeris TaxID=2230885 RepID=A0A327M4H5_9PROT|nr:FAD:protein FMN transferase [Roseicella frigidaeris]RAI57083.1 FAD:protein FMN transferase [Roseicella frigidaeris]
MRRRVLCILAAAAGLGLPRLGASATDVPAAPSLLTWTGPVLGGVGSIHLHHPDPEAARGLIAQCVAEIERLERLFSLWREDSQLSALNRHGALAAPPPDMVRLLGAARDATMLTGGLFDVTVQPLWALYRDHFSAAGAAPAGPPRDAVEAALALVDQRRLLVSPDRIALTRKGMAVTLNGIAQGYLTDRVVDLLRRAGVSRTLVDLGETHAIGRHPAGRPWRAALEDPDAPGRLWGEVELVDRALASSGDGGFVFDAAGRFTHLLDPRTGRSPQLHRAVSVLAPDATLADALSTAFSLMSEAEVAATLRRLPGVEARILRHDGTDVALRGDA